MKITHIFSPQPQAKLAVPSLLLSLGWLRAGYYSLSSFFGLLKKKNRDYELRS